MSIFILKLIALITMTIDHVGAVLEQRFVYLDNITLYFALRQIGRISFPLFAFSVGIGLKYSRDILKYMSRMFIFALATVIPFSIFVSMYNSNKISLFSFYHLNIMFSFFGTVVVVFFYENLYKEKSMLSKIICIFLIMLTCWLSSLLNTDYNFYGVLIPFFIYLAEDRVSYVVCTLFSLFMLYNNFILSSSSSIPFFHRYVTLLTLLILFFTCFFFNMFYEKNKFISFFIIIFSTLLLFLLKFYYFGSIADLFNALFAYSSISLIFIALYNDTRGPSMKYLFYIYYPAHLLIVSFIGYLIYNTN